MGRIVRTIENTPGCYLPLPRGYGFVRKDYCSGTMTVAPIPLNLLLRLGWLLWIWATRPWWESALEERLWDVRRRMAYLDQAMRSEEERYRVWVYPLQTDEEGRVHETRI